MKHLDGTPPLHDCCGDHFPADKSADACGRTVHSIRFVRSDADGGAIYILQPERVHPVDVPLRKAMVCVTKWGAGAAEMRAAIRSGNK